jgi:hypothetical protein
MYYIQETQEKILFLAHTMDIQLLWKHALLIYELGLAMSSEQSEVES